jgi:hypothetical protein
MRRATGALVIQQLDLICHFEPVTLFSKQRGYFAKPEDVLNLACAQIAALEAQLGEIGKMDQMIDRLKVRADRKWQLALAEMFSDLRARYARRGNVCKHGHRTKLEHFPSRLRAQTKARHRLRYANKSDEKAG